MNENKCKTPKWHRKILAIFYQHEIYMSFPGAAKSLRTSKIIKPNKHYGRKKLVDCKQLFVF